MDWRRHPHTDPGAHPCFHYFNQTLRYPRGTLEPYYFESSSYLFYQLLSSAIWRWDFHLHYWS